MTEPDDAIDADLRRYFDALTAADEDGLAQRRRTPRPSRTQRVVLVAASVVLASVIAGFAVDRRSSTGVVTTRTQSSSTVSPSSTTTVPQPITTPPAPPTTQASPPATDPAPETTLVPGLTVWVRVPRRSMASGTSMAVDIVVRNDTGRVLDEGGCGSLFLVLLTSPIVKPSPAWPLCETDEHIPRGTTSYPMMLSASWNGCSTEPISAAWQRHLDALGVPFVRCLAGGALPGLPPGQYQATVFQSVGARFVDPVTIEVTA
jgi:hypothetical protein